MEWRPITLPGDQANIELVYDWYISRMANQFGSQATIELNDCLYRNLYRHDYLMNMNINQMILPQQHSNWSQMIDYINEVMCNNSQLKQVIHLNE